MRAHWPYLQAYFVRGATCWVAARAVAAIVALFASLPALPVSTAAALEAVIFADKGRVLATGGSDGSLRIWDLGQALGERRAAR